MKSKANSRRKKEIFLQFVLLGGAATLGLLAIFYPVLTRAASHYSKSLDTATDRLTIFLHSAEARRVLLRLLLLAASAMLMVAYSVVRARKSEEGFARSAEVSSKSFHIKEANQLVDQFRETIIGMRWVNGDVLADFLEQVTVTATRERVTEEVDIQGRSLLTRVRVRVHEMKAATNSTLPADRIVVLSRPRKGRGFRNFRLEAVGSSRSIEMLPFVEVQALLWQLIVGKMRSVWVQGAVPHWALELAAEAVSERKGESFRDLSFAAMKLRCAIEMNADPSAWTRSAADLHALLVVVSNRRPIAVRTASDNREFAFSFEAPVLNPSEGRLVPVHFGLNAKRKFRSLVGLTPKLISIPLVRELGTMRYSLEVTAPSGMYLREVGAWNLDDGLWLPNLDRESNYIQFTGHQILPDRLRCQYVSSALHSARAQEVTNPRLAVRLSEIPSGSLGPTALLCASAVLTVWVIGVTTSRGTMAVDPSALAVAAPGVLALVSVFRRTRDGYTSFTSLFQAGIALLGVALAVVLMLALDAYPGSMKRAMAISEKVGLMDSPVWLFLFLGLLFNLLFAACALLMSYLRYHRPTRAPSFFGN